jgi:hypothetical protein
LEEASGGDNENGAGSGGEENDELSVGTGGNEGGATNSASSVDENNDDVGAGDDGASAVDDGSPPKKGEEGGDDAAPSVAPEEGVKEGADLQTPEAKASSLSDNQKTSKKVAKTKAAKKAKKTGAGDNTETSAAVGAGIVDGGVQFEGGGGEDDGEEDVFDVPPPTVALRALTAKMLDPWGHKVGGRFLVHLWHLLRWTCLVLSKRRRGATVSLFVYFFIFERSHPLLPCIRSLWTSFYCGRAPWKP